ncbi:MAG: IS200/IS605 family transposase [Firmicutes bacterium]|nr:IS200/IS605 family transposase [Bacillota bacterium]
MEREYHHTPSTVFWLNYHFVFCPRYRRRVLINRVEERLKELIQQICAEHDWSVDVIQIMPDYVHLSLGGLPTDSPSKIMATLKGISSRRLRQEFSHLRHLSSLWTRSFFVSTEGKLSDDTIKRYVESQKKRG